MAHVWYGFSVYYLCVYSFIWIKRRVIRLLLINPENPIHPLIHTDLNSSYFITSCCIMFEISMFHTSGIWNTHVPYFWHLWFCIEIQRCLCDCNNNLFFDFLVIIEPFGIAMKFEACVSYITCILAMNIEPIPLIFFSWTLFFYIVQYL